MDNLNQFPPENTGAENSINLRHYWHVVLERRWMILTTFISVIVLCIIYLLQATPIYQATARMQIDRESENVLDFQESFSVEGREQDYLQTQYKNLTSRSLIKSVVKKLNLEEDPRYAEELDPINAVMEDITIDPIRLSRLVDIKAEHPDREKAAAIANTLMNTFIDDNLENRMAKSIEALMWLKNEAEGLEKDVKQSEEALAEYRRNNGEFGVSLDESQNIIRQSLMQVQSQLDQIQSEVITKQKVAEEVENMVKSVENFDTIPQISKDPYYLELKGLLAEREARLANLKERYGEKWPDIIRIKEEIQSLKSSIKERAENIRRSILTEAEIAKRKQEQLQSELEYRKQRMAKLSELRIEYDTLMRKADKNKALYDSVLASMKQTKLMGKDKTNNMRVVDEAPVPLKPVKPRVVLTLLLGVVGGMGVSLGLAFFVNYLDDSIKSQDDVETYLRLPFLGYVPNIKTNSVVERDLQSHLHPQSNAAEGFRTIRATLSLMQKPEADKSQVYAVTSTIPAEGKSLMASNLAIVTAQTGQRTLLVDADLRRPSVHKAFQIHSPVGLSAYLSQEVSRMDEIVHPTEVPNLDVVCCGGIPSTPSELVGSKQMQKFLREVCDQYDRVFLDCPPISAVSDPLVIAAMSDGVVFVTKFNKIRRENARKSVQRIQDAGIKIHGIVLNDIDFEGKDSYYYSYYYYQNRYYNSHYKNNDQGGKPKRAESTVDQA